MKLKRLWRNKLQKSKLELHLQEFRSLVEELRPTDNDINETDLEKGYEELDGISDAATVTLMKINNKIEYLNEQLEKEEKLWKEQLQWEQKLCLEKNEQEQRQSDRDQALKRLEMEQEIERMKLSQEEKLEFKKLQLERTKIESEKELKTHGIEIQVKATSTSHTKPGNTPFIKLPKLELTRFDRNILKCIFWAMLPKMV